MLFPIQNDNPQKKRAHVRQYLAIITTYIDALGKILNKEKLVPSKNNTT